ncbi:PqqD family protein [bacterium]|nr:PqqD family protein [candidate division CSSED10-310 bacterium]
MDPTRGRDIYRKKEHVVVREIAGETLLVPVRGRLADMQRVFTLNGMGRYIWENLDGQRDLSDIADNIRGDFETTGVDSETDLIQFIDDLQKAELIEKVS